MDQNLGGESAEVGSGQLLQWPVRRERQLEHPGEDLASSPAP